MKKRYLLIGLLSVVFLWFGSVSFADAVCEQTAANALGDCLVTNPHSTSTCYTQDVASVNACKKTDCEKQSCAVWYDSSNSCDVSSCTTPTMDPTWGSTAKSCSERDSDWTNQVDGKCPNGTPDGFSNANGTFQCCNPQAEWSTWSYCKETPLSSLNNDPHALVSIPGISCECEKWRGEYYDATEWKTKCGLCTDDKVCCGTKLNTKIPFIGDCIESSTQASGSAINETTAFPVLVTALVKILVSVILIASFVMIIAAGVMIATWWSNVKAGKDMIIKVAIWLAILWASGVILRLINPNFFG